MKQTIFVVALLVVGAFAVPTNVNANIPVPAGASSDVAFELEGFAWTPTIGWISMNCSNPILNTTNEHPDGTCSDQVDGIDYGVGIMDDGSVAGYAWSPNVGWIQFGGFDPVDFPSGAVGTIQQNVSVDGTASVNGSFSLTGWARACAATVGGDCSSMATDPNAGGWDGWISLAGETVPSGSPVTPPTVGSYDVSAAIYDGVAYDINRDINRSMFFNNTGSSLYVLISDLSGSIKVRELELSMPYDVSSVTSDSQVISFPAKRSGTNTTEQDILFNDDGTVMYTVDSIQRRIDEFSLSPAYDISTALHVGRAFQDTSMGRPLTMLYNDTGTVLYTAGFAYTGVRAYALSTPYDISSAAFDDVVLTLAPPFGSSGSPRQVNEMIYNGDGSKLYVLGQVGFNCSDTGRLYSYDLSTPYDISTATNVQFLLNMAGLGCAVDAMTFNDSGSILYISGGRDERIHAYNLGTVSGPPVITPGTRYGVTFVDGEATTNSFAWGGPITMGWIDFSPSTGSGVTLKPTAPPADIETTNVTDTPGIPNAAGEYNITFSPVVEGIPDGQTVRWELSVGAFTDSGDVIGTTGAPSFASIPTLNGVPFDTSDDLIFRIDTTDQVTETDETNNTYQRPLLLAFPPPVITITGPEVVRAGDTPSITARVTAPYDVTCSFRGPGLVNQEVVVTATPGFGETVRQTAPLQNSARVEVSCAVGSDTYTETFQIEVIPTFQEI